MFVRVKITPNSPRKSVQIVASVRTRNKISQKIVRHVGIAFDDKELEQLKALAESIKIKLEADNQELMFSPEKLAAMKATPKPKESDDNYKVNLKNLTEEQRVVSGIHDIYGYLFDELGFHKIIKNPARHKSTLNIFKNIVLARIANLLSKMASVEMLEENCNYSGRHSGESPGKPSPGWTKPSRTGRTGRNPEVL